MMAIQKHEPLRTPDLTFMDLGGDDEFSKFFSGLVEILQKKLQKIEINGKRYSYYIYDCGQLQDRRNRDWKPFKYMWDWCDTKRMDFYVAKDILEERLGRQLVCECEILVDKQAMREKDLANAFGADFGEPGRDFDFF